MPSRLVLVRHAHPRAGYGDEVDPGLDAVGREQAAAMAAAVGALDPRPIAVSPLRRTRETAEALERRWGTRATLEPRVGEIPSPFDSLTSRTAWLQSVLRSTWTEQPNDLHRWRSELFAAVRELSIDAVVVTHFVAINTIVGAATGDDSVVSFAPDYCSQTVVDADEEGFTLVELGAQATTRVR